MELIYVYLGSACISFISLFTFINDWNDDNGEDENHMGAFFYFSFVKFKGRTTYMHLVLTIIPIVNTIIAFGNLLCVAYIFTAKYGLKLMSLASRLNTKVFK